MTVDVKAAIQTSLRNHILLSVALIVLLLGGIAAWASTTQISGAVVAPGSVAVRLQCPEGAAPDGWHRLRPARPRRRSGARR